MNLHTGDLIDALDDARDHVGDRGEERYERLYRRVLRLAQTGDEEAREYLTEEFGIDLVTLSRYVVTQ